MDNVAYAQQAQTIAAVGFLVDVNEHTGATENRFLQLFYTATDARKALVCAATEIQVLIFDRHGEVSPLNLTAALHKDNPLRDIYLQKHDPKGLFLSRMIAAGARGVVSQQEFEQLVGAPLPLLGEEEDLCNLVESSHASEEVWSLEGADTAPTVDEMTYFSSDCEPEVWYYEPEFSPFEGTARDETMPTVDLAWLEQVLDLDEMDEAPESRVRAYNAPDLPRIPEVTGSSEHSHSTAFMPLKAFEAETASSATTPVLEQQSLPAQVQSKGAGHTDVHTLPLQKDTQDQAACVVGFISGRGGVGKSSLTVLTAMDLWSKDYRVALLDMDLQFGDLSVLAGNEPGSALQRIRVDELCGATKRSFCAKDKMLLIEPPQNPALAEELMVHIPQILAALKAQVDIVLVNTSCLWNEAAAVLARSADRLVVCMDQRATSISAARQVVDLCYRLQIPSTQLSYLLNRCARTAPITDIDASLAMGGVDIITIAEGGRDVDELLSLGCPQELLSAQPMLQQTIQELGRHLVADLGARPGPGKSSK